MCNLKGGTAERDFVGDCRLDWLDLKLVFGHIAIGEQLSQALA